MSEGEKLEKDLESSRGLDALKNATAASEKKITFSSIPGFVMASPNKNVVLALNPKLMKKIYF